MTTSLASIKRGWASPIWLWSVTPQATSILCRNGRIGSLSSLNRGSRSGAAEPQGQHCQSAGWPARLQATTAVAAAGQPRHDTSGLAGQVAWIAQDGLDYCLGSPRTGVPSGRRLISYTSWICLNGYLEGQMIAMLRVDWPWLPFSPPERSSAAGLAYSLSPVLLLKVVEWTNPACVRQSRLEPFNAVDPRANHSRNGCDHARIGDSTVERPGRRVSKRPAISTMCAATCGVEASAALTTRFHLMVPSQSSSSPAPWIHGG